jgi:hypothetical protein
MCRVATWITDEGYALCGTDATLQTKLTGGCHEISWNTPDNAIPFDRDPPLQIKMPSFLSTLVLTLASIQTLGALFFAFTLCRFRHKRLLKASQPAMMWLVLLAAVYGAIRIGLAAAPITDAICIADFWTGHWAFTGIIALMMKTLRVHLIVNTGGFRRTKISTVKVFGATSTVYALMLLYFIIVTIVSPPKAYDHVETNVSGLVKHTAYCASPSPAQDYILYAFEALVLVVAAKLCFDTKDVPDAINETQIVALGNRI